MAEFAFAVQIAGEPAFNWWVSWVLKKRDQIVSLVMRWIARYHKRTHKFGIELPKAVEEAYDIDRVTGTTFWHDGIEKEMKYVHILFDILEDGVVPLQDHQYSGVTWSLMSKWRISFHKVRLIAGGYAIWRLQQLSLHCYQKNSCGYSCKSSTITVTIGAYSWHIALKNNYMPPTITTTIGKKLVRSNDWKHYWFLCTWSIYVAKTWTIGAHLSQ